MSTNALAALTDLAVWVLRAQRTGGQSSDDAYAWESGDHVIDGAPRMLVDPSHDGFSSRVDDVAGVLAEDADLIPLGPGDDLEDPMIFLAGSGSRVDLPGIVRGLLYAAQSRIYYSRMEETEETFARLVIENLAELKRAVRGERVRSYEVLGLSGVRLAEGAQIVMPWGVIKSAPPNISLPSHSIRGRGRETTAILVVPHLDVAIISREASPAVETDDSLYLSLQRIQEIQPLAFALAMEKGERCAPLVTFSTQLTPVTSGFGFGFTPRLGTGGPGPLVEDAAITQIEHWGRVLNDLHQEALSIATGRIVKAIAERADRADALIDAVMAWESLVGTKNETVFRVTAALARLLKSDPAERIAMRRDLGKIYDARSRLVHGEAVEVDVVQSSADEAIEVALQALRALYAKSGSWVTMTSQARAEALIMGE